MTRSEKLGFKVSRELAEGTIADAGILPIPAMRDDLNMEQREAWHALTGATYFYLLNDDETAKHHAGRGLALARGFLEGNWRYRAPDAALWQRYQSSVAWSQLAIRLGYWIPPLGQWEILRALFNRLRDAQPDDMMKPHIEHELVWAMAAFEAGQQQAAIDRVNAVTRGKGEDARLLLAAFDGQATFERLEQFLAKFHTASLTQKNLYRKQSLVGQYVLNRFHAGSAQKLPPELQDHLIILPVSTNKTR
jgi:hypothetical protein